MNLLLLHGLPSPVGDLRALARELNIDGRVYAPALPGYGSEPARPGAQGVDAVEAWLVEQLTARDMRNLAIVGYSMGAYRALSLAMHPALDVSHVICLAGMADLSSEQRAGMKGFADSLRRREDLRSMLGPLYIGSRHRALHPEDCEKAESWLGEATPETLIEELEDLARCPSLLPRLSSIRSTVGVRAGDDDVAIPWAASQAILDAIPCAISEVASGIGHALLLEDMAATVGFVARVLAVGR